MAFTANRSFTLVKGLYLEERKGAKNYKARAIAIDRDKPPFLNTGTDDFRRADRIARSWFRGLQRSGSDSPNDSGNMWKAAEGFLATLDDPEKQNDYRKKWNAIRDFFRDQDVADVTSPVLNDFVKRRRAQKFRGKNISNSTIHKGLVTIRQILKWSILEGLVSTGLPLFPKAGKIKPNARPWLERNEWAHLQKVAQKRIDEAAQNSRLQEQRTELLNFMILMVSSCARVDELRRLRRMDCEVLAAPTKIGGKTFHTEPYLRMWIRGKTKDRFTHAGGGAVGAYQDQISHPYKVIKKHEPLFREHHRDSFRELLHAAHLETDRKGRPRNMKSLRPTGIMLRVLRNPQINLKVLADEAGTSMDMLDKFYIQELDSEFRRQEMMKKPKP